jgi:hypothetical protein
MNPPPQEFIDGLTAIGGLNPFGQPMLRCVDGEREETWEAGGWHLKYTVLTPSRTVYEYRDGEGKPQLASGPDAVPAGRIFVQREHQDEVGEERLIIERWRSAEFLAKSGRFSELIRRDADGTELLRELPAEGHYDFFMRLQRQDGTPHPPDDAALEMVRALWKYEQSTTVAEREMHLREDRERKASAAEKANKERMNTLWGFDADSYQIIQGSDGHQKIVERKREI